MRWYVGCTPPRLGSGRPNETVCGMHTASLASQMWLEEGGGTNALLPTRGFPSSSNSLSSSNSYPPHSLGLCDRAFDDGHGRGIRTVRGDVATVCDGEVATVRSDVAIVHGSDVAIVRGSDVAIVRGSDVAIVRGSDVAIVRGSDVAIVRGSDVA